MTGRSGLERTLAVATSITFVAVIVGIVVLLNHARWEDQVIVSVKGGADSPVLSVTVAHSRCSNGNPVVHVDDETGERVVLRAEHDVRGDCDDIALLTTLSVTIDEPVAERSVFVEPMNGTLECSIAKRADGACAP